MHKIMVFFLFRRNDLRFGTMVPVCWPIQISMFIQRTLGKKTSSLGIVADSDEFFGGFLVNRDNFVDFVWFVRAYDNNTS